MTARSSHRPTTARLIVNVVFDEDYLSATDKPNEVDASRPHDTGKAESHLHLEAQASRWIKLQPGDGGSTELLALEGSEPSSAEGVVRFNGVQESRSDNGTGDKNRVESRQHASANFQGKIVSPDVMCAFIASYCSVVSWAARLSNTFFHPRVGCHKSGSDATSAVRRLAS